jgi:hypothetical protein
MNTRAGQRAGPDSARWPSPALLDGAHFLGSRWCRSARSWGRPVARLF